MKKYKVCPSCGMHNEPRVLECTSCEADLQSTPIVDEDVEKVNTSNIQNDDENCTSPKMVRICDCGAINSAQSRRCTTCNEDISMNPILEKPLEKKQYMLYSIDNKFVYKIQSNKIIIGREYEMKEYLSSKPYVSRKHAELIFDNESDKLMIKNYSTTNYTFINNNMISEDKYIELKDGDEIGLGGNRQDGFIQDEAAYFIVRIEKCI